MTMCCLSAGYTFDHSSAEIWQKLERFAGGIIGEPEVILWTVQEKYPELFNEFLSEIQDLCDTIGRNSDGTMFKVRNKDRSEDSYIVLTASGYGPWRTAKEIVMRVVVELAHDCLMSEGMNLNVNYT